MSVGARVLSPAARRMLRRGSVFRCGYCRGLVRAANSRAATVRGRLLLVHPWHLVRPGEDRLLR